MLPCMYPVIVIRLPVPAEAARAMYRVLLAFFAPVHALNGPDVNGQHPTVIKTRFPRPGLVARRRPQSQHRTTTSWC